MSDSHLANTTRLIETRAREGVKVQAGGGNHAEGMWYDEYTLFGQEALEHLGYADYVDERERRSS